MWINNAFNVLGIISFALAVYACLSLQNKYVDVRYGYSTYDAGTSFHTQFTFSNIGKIPATDVKIRLTYPASSEIQRVIPPIKFTESKDDIDKIVVLEIQRLDVNRPISLLVTSTHEPKAPPDIQCHEQKSVQTAVRARIGLGP